MCSGIRQKYMLGQHVKNIWMGQARGFIKVGPVQCCCCYEAHPFVQELPFRWKLRGAFVVVCGRLNYCFAFVLRQLNVEQNDKHNKNTSNI